MNRSLHPTKTVSFTSGKGGVGKSTLLANMALHLAQRGKKVLILDGDLGLANIDILFGVRPRFTIEDVVKGYKSIDEIVVPVTSGVSLIPGGSGIYQLTQISPFERQALMDQVSDLESVFDVMLIDTASGIDSNVLYLNAAAQEIMVIVTPEPASMTDAYALIKVLNQKQGENRFSVVANMVSNPKEGLKLYKRLSDVTQKFLNVSLDYKGFVPVDQNLRMATNSQQLVARENPNTAANLAMQEIAEKLSDFNGIDTVKGGMQFFWEQMVSHAS